MARPQAMNLCTDKEEFDLGPGVNSNCCLQFGDSFCWLLAASTAMSLRFKIK